MSRTRVLLVLLAGAAALGACSVWRVFGGDDAPRDRIKIPHAKHAAEEIECVTCHEDTPDAKDLATTLRPLEEKCLMCHQEEQDKGNCGFCHTDPKHPGSYPKRDRRVAVSHADHLPRVQDDCGRCHTRLPEPFAGAGAGEGAPAMAACLGCHEHQDEYDEGRCTPCHEDLSRYPIKPLAVFSHRGNFVREHGLTARTAASTCASCHEQTFCGDCHARTVANPVELTFPEKVDADFIHRNDYVSRHSIEAAADPALCQRCHGTSFCTSCHDRQQLTPAVADPRDPHPPGWAFPGSASFHGQAARRDIVSCAACHDQGARSICVTCHQVGGIGGTPHPVDWTEQHPRSEIDENGMCRHCHR